VTSSAGELGAVSLDKVTASFIGEFVNSRNLQSLSPSEQFEAFAAYCVISQEYDEEFDPADARIGSGADLGIDAAALIVNGDLIADVEEIADLKARNNYLQARLIIIQAKSSSQFSSTVISDLTDNLSDFFSENPSLPMNEDVKHLKKLLDELYSHSAAFRRGLPELVIRYVQHGHVDRR
jgi:hypothetical protein